VIGVISLLVFILLALLVTRVATVALRVTGMSHEAARFQARSAFSGVGFTTSESEDIVNHPVRRNIVLGLMLLSTAGIVTTIGSLLLSFATSSGAAETAIRAGAIAVGLLLLWALAASNWVERRLSRLIEQLLRRFTDLDVQDYVRLLHISDEYSITEIGIDERDWLRGKRVGSLPLEREGVVVLGIWHGDGRYLGAPPNGTTFEPGDTLIVYGRTVALDELQSRQAGAEGDRAHERAVSAHSKLAAGQATKQAKRRRRSGRPNEEGTHHARAAIR
jgi:TrkA family protein